jgi:hypothetical protein
VCRLLPSGDARSWQVVYESPNQCHYFNCPYQLGHGNGDQVGAEQLSPHGSTASDALRVWCGVCSLRTDS